MYRLYPAKYSSGYGILVNLEERCAKCFVEWNCTQIQGFTRFVLNSVENNTLNGFGRNIRSTSRVLRYRRTSKQNDFFDFTKGLTLTERNNRFYLAFEFCPKKERTESRPIRHGFTVRALGTFESVCSAPKSGPEPTAVKWVKRVKRGS